jgi:hypothetical protein
MNYKTIVLELILERPQLQRRLKRERTMLQAVNNYAIQLKANHEVLKQALFQARPQSDPIQIASEALEIAVKELAAALPSESDRRDADPLSLDQAMAFLRQHTPSA